ncbi:hypothetical protein [Bacillus sp. REN3]|uniref:hypothetical protein n=1 Tax=Bacillus sp. REN3 TaxID=2802440 RepID=UPI001AEF1906|nr:hypothetical protein [Bacillus sp. REN3]
MNKYTHVKCLKDVFIDDVIVFKKDKIYKIVGTDFRSFVYYIEPEYYEGDWLPEEFTVTPLDTNFKFLVIHEKK